MDSVVKWTGWVNYFAKRIEMTHGFIKRQHIFYIDHKIDVFSGQIEFFRRTDVIIATEKENQRWSLGAPPPSPLKIDKHLSLPS